MVPPLEESAGSGGMDITEIVSPDCWLEDLSSWSSCGSAGKHVIADPHIDMYAGYIRSLGNGGEIGTIDDADGEGEGKGEGEGEGEWEGKCEGGGEGEGAVEDGGEGEGERGDERGGEGGCEREDKVGLELAVGLGHPWMREAGIRAPRMRGTSRQQKLAEEVGSAFRCAEKDLRSDLNEGCPCVAGVQVEENIFRDWRNVRPNLLSGAEAHGKGEHATEGQRTDAILPIEMDMEEKLPGGCVAI